MSPTVDLELCWGTLDQLDVVRHIEAAASAGFRCVTVSPSRYAPFVAKRPRGVADVQAALADNGVTVTIVDCLMGGLPGSPDPSAVPPQFTEMFTKTADDCFRILDDLGGETLQVAHFLGAPVPQAEMADAIGRLAEQAKGRGYRLALEFMPGTGIPDYPTASAIVAAVGADHVGVMFDTWHFARTGGNQDELEGMTPGVVAGLQVNDCPIPAAEMAQLGYVPMSDRLVPGEGVFPLGEVLATVLRCSGPVRVGIEVFSSQLRRLPPDEGAKIVHTATASVLDQIGYTAT